MKADNAIIPEFAGRQHEDRSDPTKPWYVAEDRCGAWGKAGEWVNGPRRNSTGGYRLASAALSAKWVQRIDLIPALAAKWHSYNSVR